MSKGTIRHTVRVDPELWDTARTVAESKGTNLSEVIRDALKRLVKGSEELGQ